MATSETPESQRKVSSSAGRESGLYRPGVIFMPRADSDNNPLAGRKEERLLFIRIGQLTAGDGLPIPIAPQHFIQVQAPIRERDSVLVKTYPFRLDASLESMNSKARKLPEDAIDSKDAS